MLKLIHVALRNKYYTPPMSQLRKIMLQHNHVIFRRKKMQTLHAICLWVYVTAHHVKKKTEIYRFQLNMYAR